MPYDEGLAQRISDYFEGHPSCTATPKKMFGGIAFLVNGSMSVGILGDSMMTRVGAEAYPDALAEAHTAATTGNMRPMKGYVWVDAEGLSEETELAEWIQRALDFVLTLPPK